jgi:hypothetical protein
VDRLGLAKVASVLLVAVAVAGCNQPGSSGSITIEPSNFTCTQESHAVTITLPASVHSGDSLTIGLSTGQVYDKLSVDAWGFSKQSDGSWLLTTNGVGPSAQAGMLAGVDECAVGVPGTYHMQVTDEGGHVLAEGTIATQ